MNILKFRSLDYPLTYISLIFLILILTLKIKNKTFVLFTIIIASFSRIFQYTLFIKSLQRNYRLDISILYTFFITHFTLFTTLYYYNYLLFGTQGFLYSGSPTSGNSIETVKEIQSQKSFEDNISINLINYTTSISFLVGHSEISVNTTFGKIINIFNMIDSATLLGYLISYIYSSFRYHYKMKNKIKNEFY